MKRLFIGVPVQSASTVNVFEAWQNDRDLNINLITWTKPGNWHITLYFLGDTAISQIALLQQLIPEFDSCKTKNL